MQTTAKIGGGGFKIGANGNGHFSGTRGRWRATVSGVIDQGPIGFMAYGGNQRDHAVGGGTNDDFFVKAPEVFERAATTRDDQKIGAWDSACFGQRVEALNGVGNFCCTGFALDADGPHQNMTREAIGQAMQNIADNGTGWRSDHADDGRQKRQELFARVREQAFGGEPLTALLQLREQSADTGGLKRFNHDLIARFTCKGRDLAGGYDFHAIFGAKFDAAEHALPHHGIDFGR